MRDFVRRLSGNPQILVQQRGRRLEAQHGARNAAMAYLMKSFGNFHNDVDAVLQLLQLPRHEMSCLDLAKAFSFLANGAPVPTAANRSSPRGRPSKSLDHGHQRAV